MTDKIILNYKYLLQPTKQQKSTLWNILQSCKQQYNCDRDVNAAINIVDRIPDELKQSYNLLRNGTVGTTETLTPVETSTAVFESMDLKSSDVIEAGNLIF